MFPFANLPILPISDLSRFGPPVPLRTPNLLRGPHNSYLNNVLRPS